ncbi:MAG: hypothetical protein AAGB51_05040 [Planctomycetota bacterium]
MTKLNTKPLALLAVAAFWIAPLTEAAGPTSASSYGPPYHERIKETHKHFEAMLLSRHREVLQEIQGGKRVTPGWFKGLDNAALESLIADYFDTSHMQGGPTWHELYERCGEFLAQGVDHPIVIHVLAASRKSMGMDAKLKDYYVMAHEGYADLGFPEFIRTWTGGEILLQHLKERNGRAARAQRAEISKLLEAALAKGQYDSSLGHTSFDEVVSYLVKPPASDAEAEKYLEMFTSNSNVTEASRELIKAEYQFRLAWAARGTGPAHTVGPAGAVGFERHMIRARGHLIRAMKADNTRVLPPAKMITVCMAGFPPKGTDAAKWFEIAMALQIDTNTGFNNARMAAAERWGGSNRNVMMIGDLADSLDRHDSLLPMHFIESVRFVAFDAMNPQPSVLRNAELYQATTKAIDEMIRQPTHSSRVNSLLTVKLALAVHAGRTDEARRLAAGLGNRVNRKTLEAFRVEFDRVRTLAREGALAAHTE